MKNMHVRVASVAVATMSIFAVAACGSGSGSESNGDEKGTGTFEAGSKDEIVYISFGTKNVYAQGNQRAIEDEAEKYGYKVTTLDANYDQAKADSLVQQYLASGKQPAGFLWQPPDAQAAVNSTRLLAKAAPVIQMTFTPPLPGVDAYAATSQEATGEAAGKIALAAREEAKKIGMKLHSPNGNLVIFDYYEGNPIATDREKGFNKVVTEPFNVIDHQYGTNDPDTGYEVATKALAKDVAKGIDFIWAFNLQAAQGIVRAAKQFGLTPGKDVLIFAGDCSGSVDNIENGSVYGAGLLPPAVEGRLAVRSLLQRIATGETKEGVAVVPASPEVPELEMTPPTQVTYMEVPTIIGAEDLKKEYWGQNYADACEG
jgi:ABC-type sugar transport system substrate-binding protein